LLVKGAPQQSWCGADVHEEATKVFQNWLDLNGPLFGPVLYVFERIRSYLEERAEAFDTRFGTDTAAPFFGRDEKPATHFYTATTASLIYEILKSLPLQSNTFAFVDMGSGKGRALLVASEFPFAKIVGVELSQHLHQIAEENIKRYHPASQQCTAFHLHECGRLRLWPRAGCALPCRSLWAGDRGERSCQFGGVPKRNASRSFCGIYLPAI
jgi:hypothetical protein